MAYVVSSADLDNNYFTPDGDSLPAYTNDAPPLTDEALILANAAVAAAHHDHNDPDGPTAAEIIQVLFNAISSPSPSLSADDTITHLFANFPDLINPNTRNSNGKTALAAAVESGNMRMVEMLINMGAEINMWSVQGEYELHKYYAGKGPFGWRKGGRRRRGRGTGGNDSNNPEPSKNTKYGLGLHPEYQILRTPLMIAATKGYLSIVKLLMNPPCNADHTLCAPDGQVALRLAVENGHREIVNFLPSVRKGGFRRFQHQHVTSTYRIRRTTEVARYIAKLILFRFPRAVLYKLPKWLVKEMCEMAKYIVVIAIPSMAKAAWKGVVKSTLYVKDELPNVLARQAKATAQGISRGIKATGKGISRGINATGRGIKKFITKDIPRVAKATVDFLWKLFTKYIPKAIIRTGKFLWKIITVHIPKLICDLAECVWIVIKFIGWLIKKLVVSWFPEFCQQVLGGLRAFASGSWDLLKRGFMAIASLIHSIFEAVISFFQRISLKDIWDGFVLVLKWFFVEIPKSVLKAVKAVYKATVKGIEKMFGFWGKVAVFIWEAVLYIVIYFPMKIGGAFVEYSKVFGRGCKEVLVWFNPKR